MILSRRLLFLTVAAAAAAGGTVLAQSGAPPASLGGVDVPGSSVKQIPADQFQRLHAAVTPEVEGWTTIRWQTDLVAARQEASRTGKPLFMWVMDGHPLGCT